MGSLAGNNAGNTGMAAGGHYSNYRSGDKNNAGPHGSLAANSKTTHYSHQQQHLLGSESFGYVPGGPVASASAGGHLQHHGGANSSLRYQMPMKMSEAMSTGTGANAIHMPYHMRHMSQGSLQLQQQPSHLSQHQQQSGQFMSSLMSQDHGTLELNNVNEELSGVPVNTFSNRQYDASAAGPKIGGPRYGGGRCNASSRNGGRGNGRDGAGLQRHGTGTNIDNEALKQSSSSATGPGGPSNRQNNSSIDMDSNMTARSVAGSGLSSRGGGSIRHTGDRDLNLEHGNRRSDKRQPSAPEHHGYSGAPQQMSASHIGAGSGDKLVNNCSIGSPGGGGGGPSGYDTPQFSSATAFMSQLPPGVLQETVMGMREGPRSMQLPPNGGPPLYLMSQRGGCSNQGQASAAGNRGRGSSRFGRFGRGGDSGPPSTSSVSSAGSGPQSSNCGPGGSWSSKEATPPVAGTPVEDLSLLGATVVTSGNEAVILRERFSPALPELVDRVDISSHSTADTSDHHHASQDT